MNKKADATGRASRSVNRRKARAVYALAGAGLVLATLACGFGGPSAEPTSAPSESKSTTAPADNPTAEPAATEAVYRACQDPPIQEIGLGSETQSEIADPIWDRCYWVMVPEGLDQLTFELTGLTDDLDLNVGYPYLVTMQYHTGEFWQSVESDAADEMVTIEAPKAGVYYVRAQIHGPKNPSPFTLSVHAVPETTLPATGTPLHTEDTCGAPATEVEPGSSAEGELDGEGRMPLNRAYYCVQVPAGSASLTVELHDLTDRIDLFVHHQWDVDWYDRSFEGPDRSVVIENPEPGAYYIDIAAGYQNASSAFTLVASVQ
jgi:hypothetical protein